MAKNQLKPSGWQFRRVRPDARDLLDEWIQGGFYGGFYDITEEDGATDEDGDPARKNMDHVRTIHQLLANGSAEDLVFYTTFDSSNVIGNTWFRKDIVTSNGRKFSRKPMLFYPKGMWDGTWVPGPEETGPTGLTLPVGDMGIPPETPIMEYTTGLYGLKMVHELGVEFQELVNALAGFSPQIGLPVPTDPGTLIIRVRLEGDTSPSIPVIEYFVNGVQLDIPPGTVNATPVNHAVGLDMSQTMTMFAMPCWATQKMFNITKSLTLEQVQQLHEVMEKTSEVRW